MSARLCVVISSLIVVSTALGLRFPTALNNYMKDNSDKSTNPLEDAIGAAYVAMTSLPSSYSPPSPITIPPPSGASNLFYQGSTVCDQTDWPTQQYYVSTSSWSCNCRRNWFNQKTCQTCTQDNYNNYDCYPVTTDNLKNFDVQLTSQILSSSSGRIDDDSLKGGMWSLFKSTNRDATEALIQADNMISQVSPSTGILANTSAETAFNAIAALKLAAQTYADTMGTPLSAAAAALQTGVISSADQSNQLAVTTLVPYLDAELKNLGGTMVSQMSTLSAVLDGDAAEASQDIQLKQLTSYNYLTPRWESAENLLAKYTGSGPNTFADYKAAAEELGASTVNEMLSEVLTMAPDSVAQTEEYFVKAIDSAIERFQTPVTSYQGMFTNKLLDTSYTYEDAVSFLMSELANNVTLFNKTLNANLTSAYKLQTLFPKISARYIAQALQKRKDAQSIISSVFGVASARSTVAIADASDLINKTQTAFANVSASFDADMIIAKSVSEGNTSQVSNSFLNQLGSIGYAAQAESINMTTLGSADSNDRATALTKSKLLTQASMDDVGSYLAGTANQLDSQVASQQSLLLQDSASLNHTIASLVAFIKAKQAAGAGGVGAALDSLGDSVQGAMNMTYPTIPTTTDTQQAMNAQLIALMTAGNLSADSLSALSDAAQSGDSVMFDTLMSSLKSSDTVLASAAYDTQELANVMNAVASATSPAGRAALSEQLSGMVAAASQGPLAQLRGWVASQQAQARSLLNSLSASNVNQYNMIATAAIAGLSQIAAQNKITQSVAETNAKAEMAPIIAKLISWTSTGSSPWTSQVDGLSEENMALSNELEQTGLSAITSGVSSAQEQERLAAEMSANSFAWYAGNQTNAYDQSYNSHLKPIDSLNAYSSSNQTALDMDMKVFLEFIDGMSTPGSGEAEVFSKLKDSNDTETARLVNFFKLIVNGYAKFEQDATSQRYSIDTIPIYLDNYFANLVPGFIENMQDQAVSSKRAVNDLVNNIGESISAQSVITEKEASAIMTVQSEVDSIRWVVGGSLTESNSSVSESLKKLSAATANQKQLVSSFKDKTDSLYSSTMGSLANASAIAGLSDAVRSAVKSLASSAVGSTPCEGLDGVGDVSDGVLTVGDASQAASETAEGITEDILRMLYSNSTSTNDSESTMNLSVSQIQELLEALAHQKAAADALKDLTNSALTESQASVKSMLAAVGALLFSSMNTSDSGIQALASDSESVQDNISNALTYGKSIIEPDIALPTDNDTPVNNVKRLVEPLKNSLLSNLNSERSELLNMPTVKANQQLEIDSVNNTDITQANKISQNINNWLEGTVAATLADLRNLHH